MSDVRSQWATAISMHGFPTDAQQAKMRDEFRIQQVCAFPDF
jgi:hypothetical protein